MTVACRLIDRKGFKKEWIAVAYPPPHIYTVPIIPELNIEDLNDLPQAHIPTIQHLQFHLIDAWKFDGQWYAEYRER